MCDLISKPFSCYTQKSINILMLIENEMLKNTSFSCFQTLRWFIYHDYNVKMSTRVGILTFMIIVNVLFS